MIEKIPSFLALFDLSKAMEIINGSGKFSEFKFYYVIYKKIEYENCHLLFFRAFYELKESKLQVEDFLVVFIEIVKFSFSYITIVSKPSKQVILMFLEIFNGIFKCGTVNKDWIVYNINSKFNTDGIDFETIYMNLTKFYSYDGKKKRILGAFILSAYESRFDNVSGDVSVAWDEAFSKFSAFGSTYTLDHIIVQTPEENDKDLKYYKNNGYLKLKEGHDFSKDLVYDKMGYDDFTSVILNRVGNLRLMGQSVNSSRHNKSEDDFCTHEKLLKRIEKISDFISRKILSIPSNPSFDSNPFKCNKINKNKIVGTFDLPMDDINFTGAKPKILTIDNNTYQIKSLNDIIV